MADEVLLNAVEAARRLSFSTSTLHSLIKAGEITVVRIGSRRLIPVTELHEFAARRLREEQTAVAPRKR